MPQLEADIAYLKRLLASNQIDNQTFNNQRDHMLIQGLLLREVEIVCMFFSGLFI